MLKLAVLSLGFSAVLLRLVEPLEHVATAAQQCALRTAVAALCRNRNGPGCMGSGSVKLHQEALKRWTRAQWLRKYLCCHMIRARHY